MPERHLFSISLTATKWTDSIRLSKIPRTLFWSNTRTIRSWDLSEGGVWVEDYSPQQPYQSAVARTTGFVPGPGPQVHYLDGDSHVSLMNRAFLPTFAPSELGSVPPELRPLATAEEAEMLVQAGVDTISDLISADKYTILKLRGYDVPQVIGVVEVRQADSV